MPSIPLTRRWAAASPLPSHKAFLVNLLSLATPWMSQLRRDGVPGLIGRAIDLAYEELSGRQSSPPLSAQCCRNCMTSLSMKASAVTLPPPGGKWWMGF